MFELVFKRLRANGKLTLLVILFLPILVSLGFWQLSRAEEKRQRLLVYQQQQDIPAINLLDNMSRQDLAPYQLVRISGYYDHNHYWLLDNRSRGGQAGYEIIMPLVADKLRLLVNRGWLPASMRREELPLVSTPEDEVTIEGYLYPIEANPFIKHSQSDLDLAWPRRVLQLEAKAAGEALGSEVYPQLLRIDSNSPGAFTTDWKLINSGPEKHLGYAVQWFALSLALLILYFWVLLRKNGDHE